ncbi:hypothetical protein V6N13_041039 [Hibiscus sabdariffa]
MKRNITYQLGNGTDVRFWTDVWLRDVGPLEAQLLPDFMECDIKCWIKTNLVAPNSFAKDGDGWDIMFGGLVWFLWLHRNGLIFADDEVTMRQSVLERARDWKAKAMLALAANSIPSATPIRHHTGIQR